MLRYSSHGPILVNKICKQGLRKFVIGNYRILEEFKHILL
jgi:hypothetical protein